MNAGFSGGRTKPCVLCVSISGIPAMSVVMTGIWRIIASASTIGVTSFSEAKSMTSAWL